MRIDGLTFISFTSCELQGKWNKVREEPQLNLGVFTSEEENAKIVVRMFGRDTTESYYMKKGAIVTIQGSLVQFNKQEFSKTST